MFIAVAAAADDDDDDDDVDCLFCCRQLQAADSSDSARLSQLRPLSSELPADVRGSTVNDVLGCNSQHSSTTDNSVSLTSAVSDQKPGLAVPLNHTSTTEPLIVHAGAIVSMLHLLPSIACQQQPEVIIVQYAGCIVQYRTWLILAYKNHRLLAYTWARMHATVLSASLGLNQSYDGLTG